MRAPRSREGGRGTTAWEKEAAAAEETEEKGPDSASKRSDSEPKRNKLLHELVAVVLLPLLPLPPSLHSFSEDGCHPAVSRRVCGPPSRHKDSYLTRCPPRFSAGAPSNGTPKPGARRDPDNTCSSGRRRAAAAAAARTKLRHSLTRCLLVDLSLLFLSFSLSPFAAHFIPLTPVLAKRAPPRSRAGVARSRLRCRNGASGTAGA